MTLATSRPIADKPPLGGAAFAHTTNAGGTPAVPPWRIAGEWVLRGIAVGLIVGSIVAFGTSGGAVRRTVSGRDLQPALAAWTTGPAPRDVRVQLDAVPSAATREWLGALASGGLHVTWIPRGSDVVGTALAVVPTPDPAGRVGLAVAAPPGARVTLSDDLGAIDSMVAGGGGATAEGPRPIGLASATLAGSVARAAIADSLLLRPLLVIGRVGWESKFLVRALEERGWRVDLRLALTPRADLTQGVSSALDTGRVAAVLVVGAATGVEPAALERYVRDGGGLILLDGAEGGLRPLAAGDTGIRGSTAGAPVAERGEVPPARVMLRPIVTLRDSTRAVESRAGHTAVALRTYGAGRVEQVGYRDLWRWRMMGGDSGVAAHQRWWSARVGEVAYAPAMQMQQPLSADPAPLIAWIDRFGSPSVSPHELTFPFRHRSLPWLFGALVVTLLAEWWSRRLRGTR